MRSHTLALTHKLALTRDSQRRFHFTATMITGDKHQDTPDLRQMIKSTMKDGTPPIEPPRGTA